MIVSRGTSRPFKILPHSAEDRFEFSCQNSNSAAVGGSAMGFIARGGEAYQSASQPQNQGFVAGQRAGHYSSRPVAIDRLAPVATEGMVDNREFAPATGQTNTCIRAHAARRRKRLYNGSGEFRINYIQP
jgi:hypothetical protein